MKMRIKGNSLRLRLSIEEVNKITKEGIVEQNISFGGPQRLNYRLVAEDTLYVAATYQDHTINVSIPRPQVMDWAETAQVSMKSECSIGNGELLHILVEKDFKCLTKRPEEDESGLYDNPHSKHEDEVENNL